MYVYFTMASQMFCNILVEREIQFGSSGWFSSDREGNESHFEMSN